MSLDLNHTSLTIFRRRLNLDVLLAILVGLLALALYIRTLAPSVISIADDTLEFQLVAQRGAIPHPTGYPLYALLLTLSARLLPIGDVAFRANLLSALAASVAVAFTYLVARQMRLSHVAALFSAALLAILPTFWAHATIAEVYALHFALISALFLSFLRWEATLAHSLTLPFGSALILGLGLTHHITIVLWLPALGIYLLLSCSDDFSRSSPPNSPKTTEVVTTNQKDYLNIYRGGEYVSACSSLPSPSIGGGAGGGGWFRSLLALFAPLLLYAWLPLRAHVGSIDGTYQESGLSCWVRACLYQSSFLKSYLKEDRPLSFFAELTQVELGWIGVLLVIIGVGYVLRASWRKWVLLVIGVSVNAIFAMFYHVPDPEAFWLPTLWGLVLLAGWGVEGIVSGIEWAAKRLNQAPQVWIGCASVLLFGLLTWQAISIFPQADRSDIIGPPFNGRDVLAQPLPEESVIIALLGEATYLRYLQEAVGLQPHIDTVATQTDPQQLRFDAIEAALAAGKRPFLTRELSGAGERWSLSALGPLIEVLPTPREALPPGLWPLKVPVTEQITLVGWNRSPIEQSALERITLAWQVNVPINEPLHVSARLIASDGTLLCEPGRCQKDSPPLNNAYPTTLWRSGEIILDAYDLAPLPSDGHYLFILYRPTDGSEVGRAEWWP